MFHLVFGANSKTGKKTNDISDASDRLWAFKILKKNIISSMNGSYEKGGMIHIVDSEKVDSFACWSPLGNFDVFFSFGVTCTTKREKNQIHLLK